MITFRKYLAGYRKSVGPFADLAQDVAQDVRDGYHWSGTPSALRLAPGKYPEQRVLRFADN